MLCAALTLVATAGCDKGNASNDGSMDASGDAMTDAMNDGSGDAGTPTFFAIDSLDRLVRFAPGALDATQTMTITGLQPSEKVLSLDVRPADGVLFAFGDTSRLYTLNPETGAATPVGDQLSSALSGLRMGMDFNPVTDRVRIVTIAQQSARVNPTNGMLVALDPSLAYNAGDPNSASTPHLVEDAYTNNVNGAVTTSVFAIDSELDVLVLINPPNNSLVNTIGALGVNTTNDVGFDIVTTGNTDTAYAALTIAPASSSGLYTVNLNTGAVTLVGMIGGTSVHALTYRP